MKRTEFKTLCELVEKASEDDRLWWDGYLFTSLTKSQFKKLVGILCNRFDCRLNLAKGTVTVKIPSGITFTTEV